MKPVLRIGGAFALVSLVFAGCAQPQANNAFTVQQIDSTPGRNGTVRVKLTTSGDLAEADESMLVNYVQVVAVRVASKRQREVADQRARAAYHKLNKTGQITRKKIRYLAVATEKSPDAGNRKARESVMIWDTNSQEIVGNKVYEISEAPAPGTMARFETYSAEYISTGL